MVRPVGGMAISSDGSRRSVVRSHLCLANCHSRGSDRCSGDAAQDVTRGMSDDLHADEECFLELLGNGLDVVPISSLLR